MRTTHPFRNLMAAAGLFALVAGLLLTTSRTAWTDDVDLLRFDTGNPYLFIILDTSGSMNLPLAKGVDPLLGDGDQEGSRIYEAKQAMYNVFKDVTDVHFGLATYNQDRLAVVSKHWLYVPSEIPASGSWPLTGYPELTDVLTFGAHLGSDTAGTCSAPLGLSSRRDDINRFSKLGRDLNTATKIWIEGSGNKTYLLTVTNASGGGPGSTEIKALFTAQEYDTKSGGCTSTGTAQTLEVTLKADSKLDVTHPLYDPKYPFSFLMYDGAVADEASAGTWSYQDADAVSTFGADRPFTGLGWEGNYDSEFVSGNATFDANVTELDPWCKSVSGVNKCLLLKFPTTKHPDFTGAKYIPEVDRGDVLTLDWRQSDSNRDEIMMRLAPNLRRGLSNNPDYGIASYFSDERTFPNGSEDVHGLERPGEIPLIAYGNSPLGRAINDFRCWWNGDKDNKCKGTRSYKDGFEALALNYDPEWGCRRPYLLLISDGEDNSTAESPNADVANLNSQAGIKTWAINVGDESACKAPNTLHSIVSQGKGECVTAATPKDLEDELRKLLGLIREETRAFASAAVPSVQATVEDKIFLTNFNPIDGSSIWDGHIHSFLKPLPLTTDGRPNTAIKCATLAADKQAKCHLWDAGEVLLAQSPGPPSAKPAADASPATLQLGVDEDERRVIYSMFRQNGTWTNQGRLFTQALTGDVEEAIYTDLWRGFAIDYTLGDPASEAEATSTANRSIIQTLWEKEAELTQVVNGVVSKKIINYAMGDIFHSNPLVVGSPANTRYFAENLGTKGKTCAANDPGYRCFFAKHEKRRKMLLVGSNAGVVHAIDAGQWDPDKQDPFTSTPEPEPGFDNGTGREIFAYVPRLVMPTIKDHMLKPANRKWTVDGTLSVADVFIDPVHEGTPSASLREWRTVMVGGLREGGYGYFAVDVTQPDLLTSKFDPEPRNVGASGAYVPSCLELDSGDKIKVPASGCGRAPFPAVLWEFVDAALDSTGEVVLNSKNQPVLLDEDDGIDTNGDGTDDAWLPDLGETWSIPNLGRIKLCEGSDCSLTGTDVKDKFVAIFGGGLDPQKQNRQGNYLYMVDIETGKVIYKRRLEGSAPSEPAAVDTNQDGYLDRIYLGTTAGYMYRVDLGLDSSGEVPKLESIPVKGTDTQTYTADRVPETDSGGKPLWVPKKIFTTGGRPIYYRPSVLFVAKLGRYALSFGTGDRDDLWSKSGLEGRFYVFVDETDRLLTLPMTETSLQEISVTSTDTTADYLLDRSEGQRGWFLRLNVDERVITDAFALSGISFFSSYQPQVCENGLDPRTNACCPNGFDPVTQKCVNSNSSTKLCSKTGKSRIFIVNTTNANSFMVGADGSRTKYFMVSNFVTNPYVEQGPTRNPLSSTDTSPNADQLTENLKKTMEELKKLFPKNCKFSNYRLDIKTISADTGVVFIAPVPVCIVEKNWKEM